MMKMKDLLNEGSVKIVGKEQYNPNMIILKVDDDSDFQKLVQIFEENKMQ